MMMHGMLMLFISLALGYVLCVLAEKQKDLLKTVGYTLGIAIIALSLVGALLSAHVKCCMMGKMGGMPCMKMGGMAKHCPMMK